MLVCVCVSVCPVSLSHCISLPVSLPVCRCGTLCGCVSVWLGGCVDVWLCGPCRSCGCVARVAVWLQEARRICQGGAQDGNYHHVSTFWGGDLEVPRSPQDTPKIAPNSTKIRSLSVFFELTTVLECDVFLPNEGN